MYSYLPDSFLPSGRSDFIFQHLIADGDLPVFVNPGLRSAPPGATISVAAKRLDSRNIIMVVEKNWIA